jgi:hypothetical protein
MVFSTQGRSCPHLNTSRYVQVPPHSGRNIPISLDRFFLFKSALEVHPFIVGRLHAALFVTFSSSLRPLGFKIIALHRNLLQSLLCTQSRRLRLYVITNGYTRDNGPSVARPPESRYPNQACQPRARQKHHSCTRNTRRFESTPYDRRNITTASRPQAQVGRGGPLSGGTMPSHLSV